jgi:predicted DNA-binding transcriptional regulator YafY
MDVETVVIDYTNYRGVRSIRTIIPEAIAFTQNEWHPEPQWLLAAWDVEKEKSRTFAVKDIHSWRAPASESAER